MAREGPQPVWNWRPPAADHVGFPLMAGIDPYGNTVFNRQQAVSLLAELRTWRATCDPEQADMTDEIIRLAEACRDQSHAYLWFVGD